MNIAIVGSRSFRDLKMIQAYVEHMPKEDIIVTGGGRGVDQEVERVAKLYGRGVLLFYPLLYLYWNQAGFIRNQKIVEHSDGVIAFWDGASRGTADTIQRAQAKGIPVEIIR